MVEICANCGLVVKEKLEDFKCLSCGCEVGVVLPRETFLSMVKSGLAKKADGLS